MIDFVLSNISTSSLLSSYLPFYYQRNFLLDFKAQYIPQGKRRKVMEKQVIGRRINILSKIMNEQFRASRVL